MQKRIWEILSFVFCVMACVLVLITVTTTNYSGNVSSVNAQCVIIEGEGVRYHDYNSVPRWRRKPNRIRIHRSGLKKEEEKSKNLMRLK